MVNSKTIRLRREFAALRIMDLESIITAQDLTFEYQLQKDPNDIDTWKRYLRSTTELKKQVFILERCLRFNATKEFWLEYLEILHHCDDEIVNEAYQRCLSQFKDKDIWVKYLQRLNKQTDVRFILNEYVECFKTIDLEDHGDIWKLCLEFVDKISKYDTEIAGEMMRRFLSYGEYEVDHLIKYIQWTRDWKFFYNEERPFDQWDKLLSLGDEDYCNKYLSKFKDQYSKGYLQLIAIAKNKTEYYEKALKECPTVYDFTQIYESYVEFLEPDENSDDKDIDKYEQLLNSRDLMVNDIYLRQDKEDLDVWFKRFEIFKDDLPKLLKTFVEAITTVNPLKCHSKVHKMSDIWIKYAKVYGDGGDFKTVDLIFEKSTQSKFKSDLDLMNIYKSWCEIYKDNVTKQLEILQSVLFTNKVSNISLWEFYFEILEINIDDIQQILASYNKMIELKKATPRMIINFGNFLELEGEFKEMFKMFDIGLREFKDNEIKFELYNIYLIKLIKHCDDVERIRDLFDSCLNLKTKVSSNLLEPVIILYSEFEFNQHLYLKAFNLLNDYLINHPSVKILDIIINKFSTIDKKMIRSHIDNWISLKWSNKSLETIIYKLVDFEVGDKQYQRARSLFNYLHESINCSCDKWEQFELEHGDEEGFKQMLKYKRSFIEPIGFVKPIDNTNPDEIDLDM